MLTNNGNIGVGNSNKNETSVTQENIYDILTNIQDNEVLKIADNITLASENEALLIDKNLTIDLSNKTITAKKLSGNTTDTVLAVKYSGTLTLNGNELGCVNGSNDPSIYAAIKLTTKGELDDEKPAKLIINGGTYTGTYYAITGNGTRQNTDVVINNGKFKGTTVDDSIAIFQPQNGNMIINDGEFEGSTCIVIKSGKLTINGGKFIANGKNEAFKHSGSGWNNTGDCIVVEACDYPGNIPKIEIIGGTFISEHGNPVASYYQDGYKDKRLTKFVKGGKFNKELDSELIAEGYIQEIDNEGWYIVKKI